MQLNWAVLVLADSQVVGNLTELTSQSSDFVNGKHTIPLKMEWVLAWPSLRR